MKSLHSMDLKEGGEDPALLGPGSLADSGVVGEVVEVEQAVEVRHLVGLGQRVPCSGEGERDRVLFVDEGDDGVGATHGPHVGEGSVRVGAAVHVET